MSQTSMRINVITLNCAGMALGWPPEHTPSPQPLTFRRVARACDSCGMSDITQRQVCTTTMSSPSFFRARHADVAHRCHPPALDERVRLSVTCQCGLATECNAKQNWCPKEFTFLCSFLERVHHFAPGFRRTRARLVEGFFHFHRHRSC